MENLIEIKNLTKDYGHGKGVFDVSFELRKGEILGFVGANGAGKTTTIRNIMGFLKPDSGKITVKNLDSWEDSDKIKKYVGYVPGEIAFPDLPTGTAFIKSQAEFLGVKDLSHADYITKSLQLDLRANLARMSKGMKQKTALVASLISEPEILILDEPTTGLDPLMRLEFLNILEEENKKGTTILISSHLYEELEKIADRVALIDKGKIIEVVDMKIIRNRKVKDFKIEFNKTADFKRFLKQKFKVIRIQEQYNQVTVSIEKTKIDKLLKTLADFDVKFISEVKYTLEKHFTNIINNLQKKECKNDK